MKQLRFGAALTSVALIVSLSVVSVAVAKSARPFKASTTATWSQFGPIANGAGGNATHLGNTDESGTVAVDFTNFPVSVGVHYSLTLTAANGDKVFVSAVTTLTDTASPPAGNNYSEGGTYSITGGTGRFTGATGSGTVTGSCTSSFGDPIASCTDSWDGTITY